MAPRESFCGSCFLATLCCLCLLEGDCRGGEWWKVAISSDARTSICLFLTRFIFLPHIFCCFVCFQCVGDPEKVSCQLPADDSFSQRSARTATAAWIRNSCKCLAPGRFILLPLCTGPPPSLPTTLSQGPSNRRLSSDRESESGSGAAYGHDVCCIIATWLEVIYVPGCRQKKNISFNLLSYLARLICYMCLSHKSPPTPNHCLLFNTPRMPSYSNYSLFFTIYLWAFKKWLLDVHNEKLVPLKIYMLAKQASAFCLFSPFLLVLNEFYLQTILSRSWFHSSRVKRTSLFDFSWPFDVPTSPGQVDWAPGLCNHIFRPVAPQLHTQLCTFASQTVRVNFCNNMYYQRIFYHWLVMNNGTEQRWFLLDCHSDCFIEFFWEPWHHWELIGTSLKVEAIMRYIFWNYFCWKLEEKILSLADF